MRLGEMQSVVLFVSVLMITVVLIFSFYSMMTDKKKHRIIAIKIGHIQLCVKNRISFIASAFIIPIGWHFLFSRRSISIGTDTYNYYVDYIGIDKFDFEPGYRWWVDFCNLMQMDFSMFLFASNFIIMLFLLSVLRTYLKDAISIAVAMSIYYFEFFFTSMNVLRQMIAVVIFLYSIKYLLDKQIKKYIIFILLASTFHFSALIAFLFVPIPYFENWGNRNKQLYYYVFFLMFLTIGPVGLILLENSFALNYTVDFQEIGMGFVKDYILPLLLVFFVKMKNRKLETKDLRALENLFLLVIPVRILGYSSVTIGRLSFYPSIIQVILVPLILSKVKKKKVKYIASVLIVVLYATFYFIVKRNSGAVFPFAFSVQQ